MHDKTLLQLIELDLAPAQQLLELLQAEAIALRGRDMKVLETILARKQSLIVQLEQHGRQRSQVLAKAGVPANHSGLEQLAAASSLGKDLLAKSEMLNQLMLQCRQANEQNGQAIRLQQLATANQLRILNGGESPSLYNAHGATSRLATARALSQA